MIIKLLAGAGELSDGLGALQEQLHAIEGTADAEQLEELISRMQELSMIMGNIQTEAEEEQENFWDKVKGLFE